MADPFLDTNVLIYAFTSDPRDAVAPRCWTMTASSASRS